MQNQVTTLIRRIGDSPPANTLLKTPARFKELKHMIGNTPLLAIRFAFRGAERVIYGLNASDEEIQQAIKFELFAVLGIREPHWTVDPSLACRPAAILSRSAGGLAEGAR